MQHGCLLPLTIVCLTLINTCFKLKEIDRDKKHHMCIKFKTSTLLFRCFQNQTLTDIRYTSYLNKLEFQVLGHIVRLADSEYDTNDVLGGVSQAPEMGHDLVRLVHVAVDAVLQHVLDEQRVGLVTHLTTTHQGSYS